MDRGKVVLADAMLGGRLVGRTLNGMEFKLIRRHIDRVNGIEYTFFRRFNIGKFRAASHGRIVYEYEIHKLRPHALYIQEVHISRMTKDGDGDGGSRQKSCRVCRYKRIRGFTLMGTLGIFEKFILSLEKKKARHG